MSNSTLGSTTEPKTKAEEITAILRDEILTGQYRPGERMPSERDLAARFEANRGAVRESLKKLEQLGIACITPGGVRVVPVEEASLAVLGPIVDLQEAPDPVMAKHLLEVLGALLSMAARTAMARASDEQLHEMQAISADILDHSNDSEYQSQRWRELGTLFTRVSNNLVLRLILNGLETQLLNRAQSRPPVEFQVDTVKRQAVLQRLNNAIQARDGQEAAGAIIEHFELLNRYLQLALQPALEATSSPSL
jgi:DNA-binding FadR family transcriptional regulator